MFTLSKLIDLSIGIILATGLPLLVTRISSPLITLFIIILFVCSNISFANKDKDKNQSDPLDKISLNGLKWRSVGPSLTSGRISDLAINPNKPFEYYVAVSSGGVWKTSNWGLDYTPVFDNESSYSIGCVTIDPNNTNIIWVGTGENNNQRSVAYGDGIYKSLDGGKSWKNMGLNKSEHIGNIIKKDSVLELKLDTDVKVTTKNDVIANNQILILDEYGNSNTFYHNSIYWQIITRSGDLYLRVWDKSNPYVTAFKGFKTYSLNENYICVNLVKYSITKKYFKNRFL